MGKRKDVRKKLASLQKSLNFLLVLTEVVKTRRIAFAFVILLLPVVLAGCFEFLDDLDAATEAPFTVALSIKNDCFNSEFSSGQYGGVNIELISTFYGKDWPSIGSGLFGDKMTKFVPFRQTLLAEFDMFAVHGGSFIQQIPDPTIEITIWMDDFRAQGPIDIGRETISYPRESIQSGSRMKENLSVAGIDANDGRLACFDF